MAEPGWTSDQSNPDQPERRPQHDGRAFWRTRTDQRPAHAGRRSTDALF